jgi:hypothetical protein
MPPLPHQPGTFGATTISVWNIHERVFSPYKKVTNLVMASHKQLQQGGFLRQRKNNSRKKKKQCEITEGFYAFVRERGLRTRFYSAMDGIVQVRFEFYLKNIYL